MRSIRVKTVATAVAVAAVALLVAGCSGSGKPGASSSPGGAGGRHPGVQTLDSFAACMRGHGVANFYFSPRGSTPSPASSGPGLSYAGYPVAGVNPQTAQYQSAFKACQHIIGPYLPPPGGLEKVLQQLVKAAACMRSHGYPGYADPSLAPGGGQGIFDPGPPTGVDMSSPQYLKAAKTCRI
jgi:hypothetical protein